MTFSQQFKPQKGPRVRDGSWGGMCIVCAVYDAMYKNALLLVRPS